MTGAPVIAACVGTPENRSARRARSAKRFAMSVWVLASMFTQKIEEREMIGCAEASRFTQTSTIGGSAETLVNAFAVKP
jgi:hypothetical protein